MRTLHVVANSRLRCESDALLTMFVCESSSIIEVAAGMHAIFCPIIGSTSVATGDMHIVLQKGDIYVADAVTENHCIVSPKGVCVAFICSAKASIAMGPIRAALTDCGNWYPALYRNSRLARELRLLALNIYRQRLSKDDDGFDRELFEFVNRLQAGFQAMIARCPGPKLRTKQSVFLRLQRVRNYMHVCAHRELDVARLSLMANYSVSHFITTFRTVFLETPYSTINRHRIKSAETLLLQSTLGIGDIAQAIGFSSRSSFSRAIKMTFGLSPTAVRIGLSEASQRA